MKSEEKRDLFIKLIQREFPLVEFRSTVLKSGNIRVSPYVSNKNRNKRWMQLDANQRCLSIAMDHCVGDITFDGIKKMDLPYGLNGTKNAIKLKGNNDAVNISIFEAEQFDFENKEFIRFLHKHYDSYLRLVGILKN